MGNLTVRWQCVDHALDSSGVQGVEDCATVAAVFKLLDSFEGLLERPAIAAQLEVKLTNLLRSFLIDLQEVRQLAACLHTHNPAYLLQVRDGWF